MEILNTVTADIRKKIYNYILTEIYEKRLLAGIRIPTEKELVKQFNTNRMNAYLAMKMLQNDGVIKRNKKQGTSVSKNISVEYILKLKNKSTKYVFVLTSPLKRLFLHWPETILTEFEKILNYHGFQIFHKELAHSLTRNYFKTMCSEITSSDSCAMVIIPDKLDSAFLKENIDLLYTYNGEIFLYDRKSSFLERWPFNSVVLDPFGEGMMVASYLFERGHKNIIFLENENHGKYWIDERKKGLQLKLDLLNKNKTSLEIWSMPKNSMYVDACRRIKAFDGKHTIVTPNDYYAVSLIECAKKNGLKSPRDFLLISFDNNVKFYKYNLTTVAPPLERIGKLLAELIYKKINILDDDEKISIKVISKIIERDTCK